MKAAAGAVAPAEVEEGAGGRVSGNVGVPDELDLLFGPVYELLSKVCCCCFFFFFFPWAFF